MMEQLISDNQLCGQNWNRKKENQVDEKSQEIFQNYTSDINFLNKNLFNLMIKALMNEDFSFHFIPYGHRF